MDILPAEEIRRASVRSVLYAVNNLLEQIPGFRCTDIHERVLGVLKRILDDRIADIRVQEMVDGHEYILDSDSLPQMHVSSRQLEIHFAAVGIRADHRRHELKGFNRIPGIEPAHSGGPIFVSVGVKGKQACELPVPVLMRVNIPQADNELLRTGRRITIPAGVRIRGPVRIRVRRTALHIRGRAVGGVFQNFLGFFPVA